MVKDMNCMITAGSVSSQLCMLLRHKRVKDMSCVITAGSVTELGLFSLH